MMDYVRCQARSAEHYLQARPHASSLETTVMIAARILGFPVAMVNLLDERSQHTVSAFGCGAAAAAPREDTLCDTVVRTGRPLATDNAANVAALAQLPPVLNGEVGAYLGVPLTGRESLVIGALCVIDPRPRPIDPDQIARLQEFATIVQDQLELMRRLHAQRLDTGVATAELAEAIAAGQIVPWYQPVIDLATGDLVGFEALARWEHPTAGTLDPNDFVPFAEDSELIIELDHTVMRQALTDFAQWTTTYIPPLRMGVNMSTSHFDRPDWIGPLRSMLAETGVPGASVDLEVTETARLADQHADGAFVRTLQELGFKVWMDDFGTGWSSLEYLLRLPIDGIKIDRVMAVALGTPIGDAITKAVAGLAADLRLDTTIEGIATTEQAARAHRLGCRTAQGYLWSKAVPASTVTEQWLSTVSVMT